MRKFMHSCGGRESVLELKEHGFEAVVGGNAETASWCAKAGMDFYHCSGAYGWDVDEVKLSVDVNCYMLICFGSSCPNNAEIRKKNLDGIRLMASARSEGDPDRRREIRLSCVGDCIEAFFTCFCPTCMEKAASLGIDAEQMRRDAYALCRACKGDSVDLTAHLSGIADWFRFRRLTTTEHLLNFCRTVKAENAAMLTGVYIFTPSLAPLVGQSYGDLRDAVDIFSR